MLNYQRVSLNSCATSKACYSPGFGCFGGGFWTTRPGQGARLVNCMDQAATHSARLCASLHLKCSNLHWLITIYYIWVIRLYYPNLPHILGDYHLPLWNRAHLNIFELPSLTWEMSAGHLHKQKDLLEAARTLEEQTGRVNPDLLVDLGNAYGQLGHHGHLALWTYFRAWQMVTLWR